MQALLRAYRGWPAIILFSPDPATSKLLLLSPMDGGDEAGSRSLPAAEGCARPGTGESLGRRAGRCFLPLPGVRSPHGLAAAGRVSCWGCLGHFLHCSPEPSKGPLWELWGGHSGKCLRVGARAGSPGRGGGATAHSRPSLSPLCPHGLQLLSWLGLVPQADSFFLL